MGQCQNLPYKETQAEHRTAVSVRIITNIRKNLKGRSEKDKGIPGRKGRSMHARKNLKIYEKEILFGKRTLAVVRETTMIHG